MEYLKTFESFIFESKSVGIIYHFTTLDSLEGILEEDRMECSAVLDYISFSRNPLFKLGQDRNERYVRISFDGDSMSNKFKFEPFLYNPEKDPLFGDVSSFDKSIPNRKRFGQEREERIHMNEIKGIKKYITSVEILDWFVNFNKPSKLKRIKQLEKNNPTIDFSTVGSFTTPAELRKAA